MVDVSAVKNTVLSRLRQKVFGKSPYGNQEWARADFGWYLQLHDSHPLLHQDFMRYFREKNDVKTVLEVGCGAGVYALRYKELFGTKKYTGLDISQTNIDYCKKNSDFDFICGDIIKMNFTNTYDLVFSHAVIDHVYDIDIFLTKLIKATKKYAYINSYRGYFPDLKEHRMKWKEADKCYYNDISIDQVKKVLVKNGLNENQFLIRSQIGQEPSDGDVQLVIEITK